MVSLLLDHLTLSLKLVLSPAETVAFKVLVSPAKRFASVASKVTPLMGSPGSTTSMVVVAVIVVFAFNVAVTTTFPALTPVKTPSSLMVAYSVLSTLQVTSFWVALIGV